MDEDKANMAIRKFLKQVGVTSQRAIEDAAAGKSGGKVKIRAVISSDELGLDHVVEGEIDLS